MRQFVGRADAEDLAQIEGEQNLLARVLADQPDVVERRVMDLQKSRVGGRLIQHLL